MRPTRDLEPVLLRCTALGTTDSRRSAVHSLAQVGTVAVVPTLRALAGGWAKPPLAAAATEAIETIRARTGAQLGAVSIAASHPADGALTVAPAAGSLSVDEPS